jgi:hypothetical protein
MIIVAAPTLAPRWMSEFEVQVVHLIETLSPHGKNFAKNSGGSQGA